MEMILIVGFLLTAASVFYAFRPEEGRAVNPLQQAIDDGALILDVRTVFEFHAGHAADAVNIPVEDLEERLGEISPPGRTVVVYCRSGTRSRRAAALLRQAGFDVVDAGTMASLGSRNAS
jgi:phage shock protein E